MKDAASFFSMFNSAMTDFSATYTRAACWKELREMEINELQQSAVE